MKPTKKKNRAKDRKGNNDRESQKLPEPARTPRGHEEAPSRKPAPPRPAREPRKDVPEDEPEEIERDSDQSERDLR